MDNIQRLLQKQEIDSVAGKTAAYIGNVRPLATGILENMMHKNMNLVIAADDEEKSGELVGVLNTGARENHAVKTSVNNNDFNLLTDTVKSFGGLDLLILTVDKPELCPNMLADGIAKLLKLQAAHKKSYFTDIILLCSLQDVNKSAANPFGAELPELALTLAPYNIKVNSIVIYDVESVYEKTNVAAIPMKRYTKADDLLKAMYYLIDQQCETGQTLYVTGGLHLMFR